MPYLDYCARAMRCALVSTSGELLTRRLGAEIDAHDFVLRLGQAPAGGEYAPFVGSRTSTRYIAGSVFQPFRHMNYSSMHATLDTMQAERSEAIFVVVPREVAPWRERAGCPSQIVEFMKQHAGLPYRCVTNLDVLEECEWP